MKKKFYYEIAALLIAGSIANYADFIQAGAMGLIEKVVVIGQTINLESDGHGIILEVLRKGGNTYKFELEDAWDIMPCEVINVKFDDMGTESELDDIVSYDGPTSEWIHPEAIVSWCQY